VALVRALVPSQPTLRVAAEEALPPLVPQERSLLAGLAGTARAAGLPELPSPTLVVVAALGHPCPALAGQAVAVTVQRAIPQDKMEQTALVAVAVAHHHQLLLTVM
jgi:hypothetical protein